MSSISSIISRVQHVISDAGIRWPEAELISWVVDGVMQIIMVRPDASTTTRQFKLIGGRSLQRVGRTAAEDSTLNPVDYQPARARLIRVIDNVGGNAIREASRDALDSELPNWHETFGVPQVYVFDNVSPDRFYLYPAPPSDGVTRWVNLTHSYYPFKWDGGPKLVSNNTDVTSGTPTYIPQSFDAALVDWVCYRALSKDTEYAGNLNRAIAHLESFAKALRVSIPIQYQASTPAAATPLPAGGGWTRTG